MEIKFRYIDDYEKEKIIEDNSDLHLIREGIEESGKYLVFSDVPLKVEEIPHKPTEIEIIQDKISILEAENEKLNTQLSTVRASHSDLILDLDFRVMDIEDNLGLVPMNRNLFRTGEDDMNSTFMVVLDKIETGNYNSKEEIEGICDRYLARGRITGEEYDMLMKALDKKELEKIN